MKGVIKINTVMRDLNLSIDNKKQSALVGLSTSMLKIYIDRCISICINELIERANVDYSKSTDTQSLHFLECDLFIHKPKADQSENVKMTPDMTEVPDHGTECPDRASIMRDLGELCWHFLKGSDPLAVLIRNLMTEGEKIPDKVPHRTPLVDWLDGSDVMRALHISPRTLQTLRSNGTLPYSHIGGKIFYKREVLEDLLERNYATNLSGKEGTYGK